MQLFLFNTIFEYSARAHSNKLSAFKAYYKKKVAKES